MLNKTPHEDIWKTKATKTKKLQALQNVLLQSRSTKKKQQISFYK